MAGVDDPAYPTPPYRRLRVYAFDPGAGYDPLTATLNEAVLKLPYETSLTPGPKGEYLEVIDVDPASCAVYQPVDLDDARLLAQDGFAPSEGNPLFHQQMVYAVAMTTIRNFERALGRRILWSGRELDDGGRQFVRRLRIYPHALREANAYYSPDKKALLFGYFPASREAPGRNMPGGVVFTCLSNDVVAHETTHAILDGLHPRYIEATGPDALAFHEAFADIVALFQHFTLPEALSHQIGLMRGNLGQPTLLSELAVQFGQAIGHYGALRSAIDAKGQPDPTRYASVREPHERGAILVAAVFDGFLTIYRNRIADLLRLSTGDGSKYPDQDLHPDLVARLTTEATKASGHVLRMCLRALDYMPPVDPTFGEFLRALVTADADLVPDDDRGYRIAMIEAFRRRGIYPTDCRSLAADSLIWNAPDKAPMVDASKLCLRLHEDREALFNQSRDNARLMHGWLESLSGTKDGQAQLTEMGLTLDEDAPRTVRRKNGKPAVEVHAVRLARRAGPNGESLVQVVIEITQARKGYFDEKTQLEADEGRLAETDPGDFIFRGGCTLVVDLQRDRGDGAGAVRYCVRKCIDSPERLQRHREHLLDGDAARASAYRMSAADGEPFAFLHRCCGGSGHAG